MEPYNFWQDFFDTYQSLNDWIKALWLIVPPVFRSCVGAGGAGRGSGPRLRRRL